MVMGKATGLPMVLANKESWACVDLPTRSVTSVPAERLLRCAHLMESIFSDVTSPYHGIAGDMKEYHTQIHGAIIRCMEAEEARQKAWQAASPDDQVQQLEVHADVWSRFREAAGACGDRVPAFWGGYLLWFSVAAARRLKDNRGGPANTALVGSSSRRGWGRRPTSCGPSSPSAATSPTSSTGFKGTCGSTLRNQLGSPAPRPTPPRRRGRGGDDTLYTIRSSSVAFVLLTVSPPLLGLERPRTSLNTRLLE